MSKKNSPLDHLKQRFSDKLKEEQGQTIEIEDSEEFFGEKAYVRKLITANRKNRVFKAYADEGQIAMLAELIIQCSLNHLGKPIFTNGQRLEMMQHCDADDIETIGSAISSYVFGDEDPTAAILDDKQSPQEEDAARKNSKKTPS